eukprot:1194181-Prorocentrum_minimum.AAC.1
METLRAPHGPGVKPVIGVESRWFDNRRLERSQRVTQVRQCISTAGMVNLVLCVMPRYRVFRLSYNPFIHLSMIQPRRDGVRAIPLTLYARVYTIGKGSDVITLILHSALGMPNYLRRDGLRSCASRRDGTAALCEAGNVTSQ